MSTIKLMKSIGYRVVSETNEFVMFEHSNNEELRGLWNINSGRLTLNCRGNISKNLLFNKNGIIRFTSCFSAW